ncbi:MAG: dimethylamine monooxygenase subunit DmmA family protein [Steroidobacteraceae bacterium]
MLITGIKSKPVYAPLRADVGGRYHLMLASGPGAAAVLRVLAELQNSAPQALGNTRLLMVPENAQAAGPFRPLGLAELRVFGDSPALLAAFRQVLDESLMGTRLYVAGPESFIGLAMQIALEFDLNKDEIRAEEMGTLARRVYCVHCRATAEDVRTNIVRCAGCERWLLVRDHYSRRLAAYMGVMADAEAPGELPALKEVYL